MPNRKIKRGRPCRTGNGVWKTKTNVKRAGGGTEKKNRAKINEKTKKRRHENRETFNAERRARYHAKKIAQQVIGQESDLNADHVKIVTARWPHVAEREALQYLYPKEVKYLWIKGELENSE